MEKRKNAGFSMLELIVVIGILAVLAGIVAGYGGNISGFKVKQYVEIADSFMRKTRTDAMAKNQVDGFCLYQRDNCYYIESYKEEKTAGGTVHYITQEVRELGEDSRIRIEVSKQDGSGIQILEDNGEELTSCIRVRYATGTGAVEAITLNDSEDPEMDYTRITFCKGDVSHWIEINPVTGKHTQN